MESGVPQGSVSGPALFLFILILMSSDLPTAVKWFVKLFAFDTKMYTVVWNDGHKQQLQIDLDSLCYWLTHEYLNLLQGYNVCT